MSDRTRLVLEYEDFWNRTESLFQQVNESRKFRERFISNPAAAAAETVFSEFPRPDRAHIGHANRVLYAVLSNEQFMDWANEYQVGIEAELENSGFDGPVELQRAMVEYLDRDRVLTDVLEAIQQYETPEMFEAIHFDGAVCNDYVCHSAVVVTVGFVLLFVVVTAIDFTPKPAPVVPNRFDLQHISYSLVEQMGAHAHELRESGELQSPDFFGGGGRLR